MPPEISTVPVPLSPPPIAAPYVAFAVTVPPEIVTVPVPLFPPPMAAPVPVTVAVTVPPEISTVPAPPLPPPIAASDVAFAVTVPPEISTVPVPPRPPPIEAPYPLAVAFTAPDTMMIFPLFCCLSPPIAAPTLSPPRGLEFSTVNVPVPLSVSVAVSATETAAFAELFLTVFSPLVCSSTLQFDAILTSDPASHSRLMFSI